MELKEKKCVPSKKGTSPFPESEEDSFIGQIFSWTLIRQGMHRIKKDFMFNNFKEAISFVNNVADVAENEGHHPNIVINYNRITIELYTHAAGGLTENDFILAAKIDDIH
jgi:4a-hydroxytetrahydrobiopterin dehydratase